MQKTCTICVYCLDIRALYVLTQYMCFCVQVSFTNLSLKRVRTNIYTCMYIYTHTQTHTRVRVRVRECVRVHVCVRVRVHVCVHACVRAYACVCVCVCVYVCVCVCLHVSWCVFVPCPNQMVAVVCMSVYIISVMQERERYGQMTRSYS